MQISPINLVYKQSYTDNRNSYKRCNLGKTVMVASTSAAALSSLARPVAKEQKPALKTCGALVALSLMIGTFIDAVVNRISSGIVDHRSQHIMEQISPSSETHGSDTKLAAHQG